MSASRIIEYMKMGKKQLARQAEEFHERIVQLLRDHRNVDITQRPYKDDFFKVFREAYKSGFCCWLRYYVYTDNGQIEPIHTKPIVRGGSIWSYACETEWVNVEMNPGEDRYKRIHLVMDWWDAWTFAWEQLEYKKRKHRDKVRPEHTSA